jgi:hypothetical protein
MLKKSGRLWIVGAIVAVVLLAFICLTLFTEVGMARNIGIQEPSLSNVDFSAVPQSVIDDAVKMAGERTGESKEKLVNQLVGTYVEASDKDIVIFFNSGGMGWNYIKDTPGWAGILDGITSELKALGYRPLVLNYWRTPKGLLGSVREFFEAASRYPKKVKDMAQRVEFLIDHLPNLKVIVTGESTGTVITEEAMGLLRDKPNVYSIQTGTPFWYKTVVQERTLRINTNGRSTDSFSYGNVPAMIWATVKGWFGLTSPKDNPGNILKWLKAPGHDYSWQYPGISTEIIKFLESNFEKKN